MSLTFTMLITGVILAPAVLATPAMQDLSDLRTVINAAASAIGDPNNPNRGWGFNLFGNNGQMGTADLVNNVTVTVLRTKFQLDTNRTSWLGLTNATWPNGTALPSTPTLPLTSSLALPSVLPTGTPALESNNITNNNSTDLSTPYIDFVSSIPNLSTSLTALGRAYHREMNNPVHQAISGIQQSLSAIQSSMLANNLIRPNAVLRTIRASSSLEDAQQAWSRFLNLPGKVGGSSSDASSAYNDDIDGTDSSSKKRETHASKSSLFERGPYTHKELWGSHRRSVGSPKVVKPDRADMITGWVKQHARSMGAARIVRRFVA